jgi:hypothetical protein
MLASGGAATTAMEYYRGGGASGEVSYRSAGVRLAIHGGTDHRPWTPTSSPAAVFPASVLALNKPSASVLGMIKGTARNGFFELIQNKKR